MKKIALIMSLLIMVVSIAGCSSSLEAKKCEHSITSPATCTEAETCKHCGAIIAEALGHDWEAATCTLPKTCNVCDETEGEALGHDWEAATCTLPKTCNVCDETEGDANGHDWESATCQSPKTCRECDETQGTVVSHYYENGRCRYCWESDPYYLDVKANDIFTIEGLDFDINSVGGVEVDIEFKNRSNKQIAYVYFTLKFYDRMGNAAYCEIQHTHTQRLQYTGPINAGSRKTGYWDPLIYNFSTAAVKPLTIEIEYTDGTKITITSDGRYWYSGDFYGGSLKN